MRWKRNQDITLTFPQNLEKVVYTICMSYIYIYISSFFKSTLKSSKYFLSNNIVVHNSDTQISSQRRRELSNKKSSQAFMHNFRWQYIILSPNLNKRKGGWIHIIQSIITVNLNEDLVARNEPAALRGLFIVFVCKNYRIEFYYDQVCMYYLTS